MSNNQKYSNLIDSERGSVLSTDTNNTSLVSDAPSLNLTKITKNANMIVVKVKMINNQQKEIEIDFNSDINVKEFKNIVSLKVFIFMLQAFEDLINKENFVIKLIYQGKFLTDDKLLRELSNSLIFLKVFVQILRLIHIFMPIQQNKIHLKQSMRKPGKEWLQN